MSLLITEVAWDAIRDDFSEDEKQQLRDAAIGTTVCPRGTFVDEDRLGAEMRAKLKQHTAAIHNAQRGLR